MHYIFFSGEIDNKIFIESQLTTLFVKSGYITTFEKHSTRETTLIIRFNDIFILR
jgi:hypothetical protein